MVENQLETEMDTTIVLRCLLAGPTVFLGVTVEKLVILQV